MTRTRATLAALAFLGWAGFAQALGLGEIEVRSRLNQPISALIPIAAGAGEAEDLVVELAGNDDFERAGMERPEFLSSLRFEVQGDAIKVTSKQIAREPFVSFLLDVRWSGGRLLREYTVLLDPPTLAQAQQSASMRPATAPQATQAPAGQAMTPAAPVEPAGAAPVPAEATAAAAPEAAAPEAPPASAGADSYGPVSPKETLWSIAYKLRPDPATITMDQMQVAIFNANPQAFHEGRLTGLMKGSMLRIPSADEIRAVDAATAKAQVAEARGASGYAAAPAPSAAAAPEPAPQPEPVAEATPAPAPAETAPAAEPTSPPAEVAQAPAAEPTPPPAEAAPAAEPTPAPAQAEAPKAEPAPQPAAAPAPVIKEEPGLLAELLERGRGLVENPLFIPAAAGFVVLLVLLFAGRKIADKIAKMRYERASRKEQVAPVAAGAALGDQDVTQVAEEPHPMEAALQDAAAGGDATRAAPAHEPVAATQALGEQTLQQTMQQTMQQTQVQEPALASSGKVDFDVTGAFASETVQINLDAGDPVSEAEFHRAYGLYDEAALLLKQALQKDPKRTDAKVKLAEIYFEANKANEFVEIAKELKGQLPEAEWQKIALLGSQIAPSNELFSGGGGVSVAGGVDLSFDEPAAPAAPAAAPAAPARAPAPAPAPAPAGDSLDFSLDEVQLPETPAAAAAPAAPAEPGLEFDLGGLTLDTPAPSTPAAPAAAAASEPALDLGDFDLSAPAAAPPSGEVVELSTDLSMEAPAGAGDESSTKLDLARAYIDMGDADMARSLLNEVAQQGNADQQKEAQELLKRVSG